MFGGGSMQIWAGAGPLQTRMVLRVVASAGVLYILVLLCLK